MVTMEGSTVAYYARSYVSKVTVVLKFAFFSNFSRFLSFNISQASSLFRKSFKGKMRKNSLRMLGGGIVTSFSKIQSVRSRSCHRRCSVEKGVLKTFVKFTGKHLCQSLFFNKVAD